MGVLLGEPDEPTSIVAGPTNRLVLDLEALGRAPDAAPIVRYLRTIIVERGDFNGRVLSVRRDDVRALCVIRQCDARPSCSRRSTRGARC